MTAAKPARGKKIFGKVRSKRDELKTQIRKTERRITLQWMQGNGRASNRNTGKEIQPSRFPSLPRDCKNWANSVTRRSRSMKSTTRLFLTSIATGCTVLLISCANTQITTQHRENMLVASGFKVITPKTAAQKQKLQNLPLGNVTMIKKSKKTYYVLPDPAHNRHTSVDPKSTRLINSSAPTRSSPGKISRTPRCIRTPRWSGVCGKVAKECGDRWAGRCRARFKSRRTPEHTCAPDEVICGLLSGRFRCSDHAVWASHWIVVEN